MYSFSYTYDDIDNAWPVLGEPITITISRDGSLENTTFTMEYFVTNFSSNNRIRETIFTEFDGSTFVWTPPVDLVQYNTHSGYVAVTLVMRADNTAGHVLSERLFLQAPASVAPDITSTIVDDTGYASIYGVGIQGKTNYSISFSAKGMYGAEIYAVSATMNGKVLLQNETTPSGLITFTTDVINEVGDMSIILSATDSRGLSAQETIAITIVPYEPSMVSSIDVKRCAENGDYAKNGAYALVTFSANVHSINNKNSSKYELKYKKRADDEYKVVQLNGIADIYAVENQTYIFAADIASSYDIILSVTDDFSSVTKHVILPSAAKLWSALKNGLGFAFGKVAERVGFLDMGFGIYMNKNKIVDLAEPTDGSDAATKQYADQAATEALSEATEYTNLAISMYSCLSDPIWVNEDLSASFEGQDIVVQLSDDVSNYKAILLSVKQGFLFDRDNCRSYHIVPVGGSFDILANPGAQIRVDSKDVMIDRGHRSCTVGTDGIITFDAARLYAQSTTYIFNAYLVPDTIYGIR